MEEITEEISFKDNIHFNEKVVLNDGNQNIGFDITLKNIADGKPDCQVGNFGYNFYFRTNKGLKAESYKNDTTIKKAIEKTAKNLGFKVVGWVENDE